VSHMTVCSCGSLFAEGNTFCVNCGSPRARSATAPVTSPPAGDGVPNPPLTVSRSTIPQTVDPSPFDADSVYMQKTLRHQPMELGLDDSVSLSALVMILVRAFIFWVIISFVLGGIGAYKLVNGDGSKWLILAPLASFIISWVVLLRSKVTEPIGEWLVLLPDRAGQAESYYRMITAVLKRRQLPIDPQLRSEELNRQTRSVKHMIELRENEYQTYVTVFAYGTSLYVGWQMWRRRSGAQLFKRALADRVKGYNLITTMQRTDRARAVREAVHLACREAVYAPVDAQTWAEAQQLQLPRIGRESVLLIPRPTASPSLPAPSAADRRLEGQPV
jgi:hypothetical protein